MLKIFEFLYKHIRILKNIYDLGKYCCHYGFSLVIFKRLLFPIKKLFNNFITNIFLINIKIHYHIQIFTNIVL